MQQPEKRGCHGILTLLFAVFALSASLGFAGNISTVTVAESDTFYSSYAGNDVINLRVTADFSSVPPDAIIQANFTNLTTDCGSGFGGYVNLTNNSDTWTGTCDVGTEASTSNFVGGYVSAYLYSSIGGGTVSAPGILNPVVLYNMTRPVSNDPCLQFASTTTDMSQELNFNSVNFLVDVLVNGSAACNGGTALPWGDGFTSMPSARLSFSGLNMTDSSIGNKLSALSSAINVTIPPPHSFGIARIYVNSSAFAELNTTSTITLYNLPFASQPDVTDDPGAAGHGSVTWSQGGYDMGYNSSRGNLTIVVSGFSGYNANDSTPPEITFNNPVNGSVADSSTMVVYNITLNGTGTEISAAIFNLTKVNGSNVAYFNSTNNSANCSAATSGSEIFHCIFTLDAMGTGDRNLTVTAYDYGGGAAPGNGAANSISFAIAQAPNVNIIHPNATESNYTSGTIPLNFTADGNGLDSCWYWYDAGSPAYISPCVASTQYNYSVTPGDGSHVIYVRANNSYGMEATRNASVIVDTTGPSIGPFSSPQANSFTGQNKLVEVNASASDSTSGIADGSACAVVFADGAGNVSSYTGSVAYASSTGRCTGSLNLTGTGSEGDVSLALNVSDSFGNTNVSSPVAFFIDNTNPELAVSSPMPNGLTGLLNVSLTVSDNLLANGSLTNTSVSVAYYANGTQAASASKYVSGLGFMEIGGLSDGTYNITVTAMDKAGNVNTTLITNVTVHSTPPSVAIQAPADGANVTVNSTPLQFTATDPAGVTSCEYSIDYNSTHISLPGCNNSTANVTDGAHTITVYAIDGAGNTGNATVSFTVDATGPSLAITYPADNTLLSSTPLMVNYSVYDAHINMTIVSLIDYFNGSVMDTGFNGSNGNHTALLNVSDGKYNITATSTDFFGHSATATVSNITYDTVAPNVTLSSPSAGQYNSTPIDLNFTASDSFTSIDSCWYVLNNATHAIPLCENTTINSSLVQGSNNLTLFANDSAGNIGSANAMFGFDNASPSLSISAPASNAFIGFVPVEVNYSVYDPNMNSTTLALLYYANGSIVGQNVTSGNGNYSVLFNASDGLYNITAVAMDMFGNTVTASATNLTLDTVAPEISIQAPAPGNIYNSTNVSVNFTAYDAGSGINASSCEYYLNGAGPSSLPSCLNTTITVAEGTGRNLTVTVRDLAGRSNSSNVLFAVDVTAPAVETLSPSNGTVSTSANVSYSFNASDALGQATCSLVVDGSISHTFENVSANGSSFAAGYIEGQAEGLHNWTVNCTDLAGNMGTSAMAYYSVDLNPPVVAISSPANGSFIGSSPVGLNFTAIDAGTLVSTCSYVLNGNSTAINCTNTTLNSLYLAQGFNTLVVHATDLGGFTGNDTSVFSFDNESPSVSIAGISADSIGNSSVLSFNVTSTDANMNYTNVSLIGYSSNGTVNSTLNGTNGTFSVSIGAPDGAYNVTATAYDLYGHFASAQITNVTVDTSAPVLAIQTPAAGVGNSSSVPLNYTAYDATSGINASSCSYMLDGLTSVNLSGCANSSLTGLSQGTHNLTMTVRDMAGNSNTTQRSFTVDTESPLVNITAPANQTYGSANISLAFTSSDSISGVDSCWYVADSGNATPIDSCLNTTFAISGDGAHNVTVYSNDSAGNVGYDVSGFAVDTTGPVVNVTSPVSGNNYTNNGLTLTFSVNESQTSLASCRYSIDAGNNTTISSCANGINNVSLPVIADGWHNLTVFATDSIGNNGSSTATMFSINTTVVVDNTTTNVTASSNSSQIVLSNTSANVTITVPSNVTNVTLNLTSMTVNSSATITNAVNVSANTSLGVIGLSLPPNVTITGSNWTGGLSLPSVTTVPTANITASSGMSVSSVDGAVVVGFTQGLNLSSSARLLIPGKSGKYAGYIDSAGTFHSITTTCNADAQATVDSQLAAGAECKIDSGSDLVIWTKHFTTFVAYSQTSTGGGSGGGSSSGGSYVGAGSGGVGSFSTTSATSEATVMFNGVALPYTSSVTVSPDNVTTVTFAIRNNQSTAMKDFEVKIRVPESFTTDKSALNFNLAPDRFEAGSIVPVWRFSLLNPGETLVLFFSANKPTLLGASDFTLSVVKAASTGASNETQAAPSGLVEGSLEGPQSAYAGEQASVVFKSKDGTPMEGVVILVTDPNRQVTPYTTDASGAIYLQGTMEGQYAFKLKDGVLAKAYTLTVMQKPSAQPSMPSAPSGQQETPAAGQQQEQAGSSNAGLLLGLGGASLIVLGLVVLAIIIVAAVWLGGRKKKKGL
ncbi:MAG: Ig-like domain-containing protein [Candidatus Micrarchaeia archaeon]